MKQDLKGVPNLQALVFDHSELKSMGDVLQRTKDSSKTWILDVDLVRLFKSKASVSSVPSIPAFIT